MSEFLSIRGAMTTSSLDYLQERRLANSEMNHLEFLQGRSELISLPRRIVFELTNRCDRRCVPCAREESGTALCDLPMEAIRRFEGVLAFVEEVSLHGWGEGTLHPNFTEILGFLDSTPGLKKNFATDGSTLDRIHWNIFEHHVDSISVHLEGSCPLGAGAEYGYDGTFSSLRNLLSERQRRGKNYPMVDFVFTAMRRNLKALPGVMRRAAELGVSGVDVEFMTVYSPALLPESLWDRQEDVRPVFEEARRLSGTLGVRLRLPEIPGEGEEDDVSRQRCPLPWRDLYVGSNGRLRPCKAAELEFGRAGEWENFYDLWNSPELQHFRFLAGRPQTLPECCRRCRGKGYANPLPPQSFLPHSDGFPHGIARGSNP